MTAVTKPNLSSRQGKEKSWMVRMQSPRVQCCLCMWCVMSAMLGMSMLSVGVCLVLNYNLVDVDTSGLPPNLHNDEGKKVVGIILICMGVVSLIISGVVSTLYFTVCTRRSPGTASVGPHDGHHHNHASRDADDGEKGAQGRPASERGAHGHPSSRDSSGQQSSHHHLNPHLKHLQGNGSMAGGRNSPSLSGVAGSRRAGSLQYTRAGADSLNRSQVSLGADGPSFSRGGGMKSRSHASSTPSRSHRRGKKGGRHHPQSRRYKNPLEPHPEEAGAESQSLSESRRSSASWRRLQGHVNRGADLDDDLEMTQGSVASGGSSGSSSVGRPVLIQVDSSQGAGETSPSRGHSRPREQETSLTDDTYHTVDSSHHRTGRRHFRDDDDEDDDDDGEEDESGRMSRSTLGSQDLSEGTSEESQLSKQRLDNQILELLS